MLHKHQAGSSLTGSKGLGEIVHDIDLKDDKFNRLEAAGLNAIVNGLSENLGNDRKLLQQSACIFDGLLALFCAATCAQSASEE